MREPILCDGVNYMEFLFYSKVHNIVSKEQSLHLAKMGIVIGVLGCNPIHIYTLQIMEITSE